MGDDLSIGMQSEEDTEELEEGRSRKNEGKDYCSRYKTNFENYCKGSRIHHIEGVLATFCGTYIRTCKSDQISDLSSIETIELPEDEDKMASIEKVHGKIEGAAAQTQTSSVSQYCDQFIENYHFYCVGEILAEHAKFCNSFKKNCPEKVGSLKESGTFLGEKESHSSQHAPASSLKPSEPSSEDVITTSSTRHQLYEFKGGKKEYCDKFSVNYEYFCNGGSTNVEITSKFCVSYKSACRSVVATTTQAPDNSDDFPDFDHPERTSSKRKNRKKKKKAYKRPCTADCDQRIYPHCTQSCKCDYAYPSVQKFCNPPPLPFFLNTCRLWYNGCPKYEQYHYASQFIYSKAEKGKVVEGPQGSKPFSILSPNGEQIPINQRIPNQIERVLWDGPLPLSDNEHEHVQGLVEWDLKGFDKKSEKTNLKGETLAAISPDKFEFDKKWFRDDPPPDPFEPEPRDGDAEKSKSNDSKDVKTTDKAKR
ncbi:hypothetical protein WR25_04653 [Diploscapter pachys]|uniref:Uncharacterized protein n=1 Tax=Diploscapter pachys TaxID=2018661 RepID=A0A2A2KHU6_9BILA|nr:hypothetical protein WR25_04653 [Diploscapter pachys]